MIFGLASLALARRAREVGRSPAEWWCYRVGGVAFTALGVLMVISFLLS